MFFKQMSLAASVLAGFIVCSLDIIPVQAQQPGAPTPPPPGSALSGRPETEGAARLAPIAPPPIPTAADKLPTAKLKVPPGFKVEVFASGVPNARSIRIGDKGTVFVGSRLIDKVHAIVEKDGNRQVKVIASGLHRPNGLAFHGGALYVAELSKVWRYDGIEDSIDSPPKPTLISDQFPKDEPHGWKFIAIGPDEKLYVPVGAPGNINNPDQQTHAHIRRMNLDGSGMEVLVQGVRNTVGFDWHPVSKELYFTDNGRDWVSEDLPEDELNRVTATGKKHFGYPFCHQGNFRDPEYGWGHSCDDYEPPAALLGSHTAALGMRFYTGDMFPAEYKNAIFIARHGAWNRTQKTGGDIVVAKLNPDGTVKSVEPFLTGFVEDNKYIGRPVDVQVMKDGSMLVSDDFNGAVYRVSHGG
jgi:glucose/arabinose dehydrogenase